VAGGEFRPGGERAERQHGGTLVLIGGPDEIPAAGLVERTTPRSVNLAGRLSLPVMAAVIARLSVLVTNDSGPAHMAYALGTPSVTIFGGTDARRWGPKDRTRHLVVAREVPCRPCEGDRCPVGFRCLAGVGPGEVVARVGELAGRCFRPKPPLA
jgi:ADP-heptose:LPS heptosyltransferase